MPFNGGGTFTVYVPGTPLVNGTVADADVMNLVNNDFATGLTTAWPRDGQAPPTANIPMGGYKFTGMGVGTAATDSATLAQVQAGGFQDAGTTSGTNVSYVATLSPAITAYATGQLFRVKFDQTCGATPVINFNSVGTKNLYYMVDGTVTQITTGNIQVGFVGLLRYDSTLNGGAGAFLVVNSPNPVLLTGTQTVVGAKSFSAITTHNAGVSTTTMVASGAVSGTTITGSSTVQGTQLISTVSTGTAPLTVASTTKVTNLNADLLDGLNSDTVETASTIVARDSNGDISGRRLFSSVAGGTAPLVVASTTVVTNLRSDYANKLSYNTQTGGLSAAADGATVTVFTVVDAARKYRVKLTFVVNATVFGFVSGDEIQIQPGAGSSSGNSGPTIWRSGTSVKMTRSAAVYYITAADGTPRRLHDDITGTFTAELIFEGDY